MRRGPASQMLCLQTIKSLLYLNHHTHTHTHTHTLAMSVIQVDSFFCFSTCMWCVTDVRRKQERGLRKSLVVPWHNISPPLFNLAHVWLTRLIYNMLIRHDTAISDVICATWSNIVFILLVSTKKWCDIERMCCRVLTACPLGTSLYGPSYYFEQGGHCLEVSRRLDRTAPSTKRGFCFLSATLQTARSNTAALASTFPQASD